MYNIQIRILDTLYIYKMSLPAVQSFLESSSVHFILQGETESDCMSSK